MRIAPNSSMQTVLFRLIITIQFAFLCSLSAHPSHEDRLASINQKISKNPNDVSALLDRAVFYQHEKLWKRSLSDAKRVLEIDPGLREAHYLRASSLKHLGQFENALSAIDFYLQSHSSSIKGHLLRARVNQNLGNLDSALEDFDFVISNDLKPIPDHYLEYSQALLKAGQADNAIRVLDKGILRLGNIVTLQSAALEAEMEAKSYEQALKRIEYVLQSMPHKARWNTKKADVLILMNKKSEARQIYQEALEEARLARRPPLGFEQGKSLEEEIQQKLASIEVTQALP